LITAAVVFFGVDMTPSLLIIRLAFVTSENIDRIRVIRHKVPDDTFTTKDDILWFFDSFFKKSSHLSGSYFPEYASHTIFI
jgi:hypothetical protein